MPQYVRIGSTNFLVVATPDSSGSITVRCPTGDEGVGKTLTEALVDLEQYASGCEHCLVVVIEAVHLG